MTSGLSTARQGPSHQPINWPTDPILEQDDCNTLRQSRAFLAMPYASVIINSEGVVVCCNRRASRMIWGLDEAYCEQIAGRHLSDATPLSETECMNLIRQALVRGAVELPLNRLGTISSRTNVRFRATMLPSDGTGTIHVMLTHDCLSATADALARLNTTAKKAREREQKMADEANMLSDALSKMSTFTQAASHDLKAPLGNLRQLLELFAERFGGDLPPDAMRYLGVMSHAASSLNDVTHGLLDHARASSSKLVLTRLRVEDIIAEARTALTQNIDDAKAEFDIATNGQEIWAEPTLLRSLILNLLSNALKYRDPSRPLTITIRQDVKDGRQALSISDTGMGFDQAEANRIFRPFERLTSAAPGTGIGLATCSEICRRHNWDITAEGATGVGARFTVRMGLPAFEEYDEAA